MKKVIILIAGYLIIGVTIVMMQSCFLSYDDWIADIVFKGNNRSTDPEVDDLTEKIGFQIIAGNSSVSHRLANIKNIDLFSKCYATTKCANWQNSLDISSFSMVFDKSFVYDSDTIEAGMDILKLELMRKDILIEKNQEESECLVIFYLINFSPELTKRLTFETGEYVVSFSCRTNDGKEFNKSRRVIFYED